MNARNGMRPVHPGEILRAELDELGLSANALSKALCVPVNRVTMILNGQRGISADTALRLARHFGTTPQLWMNLQKTWELRQAEVAVGHEIDEKVAARHYAVMHALTSPAFRPGDAQLRTAFVLSAPGSAECKAQRPAAGQTGATLTRALPAFQAAEPRIFPSLRLDDYTLVNAWDRVEYEALTGRTEATTAEILDAANIDRLAQCLQYMDAVVALGKNAQLAVDKAWYGGAVFTGDHPSWTRLNRAYDSCADAPGGPGADRIRQWARSVLSSKRRR